MHDESDGPSVAQGVQSHAYWFEWFWWSVPLQPFCVVDVELHASRCKLLRANTGKVMVVAPVERDADLNESHARGEKQIWLELNKVGVWWCDWGVLDVVVGGVGGGVGG